jgi:dipeptidyl aminopeptidase/acylaminoacyl peptidase
MNVTKSLAMGATALMLAAGAPMATATEDAPLIDRTDFKSKSGIFDIDALMSLGRVSSPKVSPDKKKVLYGVSYESVEQNKSNNDLYVCDIDGKNVVRLTKTPKSESNAVWIDGGKRIAFMYADAKGQAQMWVMDADGSNRQCVSDVEGGIAGFLLSPDEKKIVVIRNLKSVQEAKDLYPDLPEATGRVIDDLMYKHWDEWVTEIPHPFVGSFDGTKVSGLKDIMDGEPYEAPMKPFGGVESFAWSPDSENLIYVSRKKTGKEYAESTNSDLYKYNLASGETKNITEGMMGYDQNPAYSADGKYVAWLSMERDGYEADKQRLFIMDTATGEKTDLTANWDYTIEEFAWRPDGKSIVFIAYYHGGAPVFSIDLKTKAVSKLAEGQCDYTSLEVVDNNNLITMQHSMVRPNELYSVYTKGKKNTVTRLTDTNDHIFNQLTMPTVEGKMVPTTDGKEMLTWVVYPPKFDSTKKYPAILFCEGGPQSSVSQFWSYRWNFALQASNGYIMIAPNRRGVPGFGTEWEEQISKDYTGQNMKDYLSAVDYMKANEPAIDAAHIGCTGASYGGYSTYWLAGNHDHRFAAFFAHAGIFNTEAQYLETEEMWFANWDMGGAYWDKNNAAAQRTYAESPHKFVDKWDAPIMISHGEYDFRILASQGMMAFNAAKLRGIPAEMVIFPDENHWILKPQNAVQWQRLFFRWFDKWLKPESK